MLYLDVGVIAIEKLPSTSSSRHIFVYDRNKIENPLVSFSIGLQNDFRYNLSARIEIKHESMPSVRDTGENRIEGHITWRPFRK